MKKAILIECVLITVLAASIVRQTAVTRTSATVSETGTEKEYIKWVDFNVSYEVLCKAYEWDVETHDSATPINWVDLIAYVGTRTGGEFGKEALAKIDKTANEIVEGKTTMEELTKELKNYSYYREAYGAVLDGMVGEYDAESIDDSGIVTTSKVYGLKSYFPLARGFDYNHYDDFGAGRSFGYKRKHLGHDMMEIGRAHV